MDPHPLGNTGLLVTSIGYGAFKIGRNEQIKYPAGYDLPSDDEANTLIRGVLDVGVTYFDTAPAYGVSEERLGRALDGLADVVISTKVGETFEHGQSQFDFSDAGVRDSIERSRRRLRRDALDLVFVHTDGDDLQVQQETDVIATLQELKQSGDIRAIGFSGKTVEGARRALDWADVIMVAYNQDDDSHAAVIEDASKRGVGVVVKKGLGSGNLPAADAVRYVLANRAVDSVVVGSLNPDHIRRNVGIAESVRSSRSRPPRN